MADPILFVLRFIFDFWWLLMPILISQIVWDKFKSNQKREYWAKNFQLAFLEIKFPPGISRTPRAMEEVFTALHAIHPDPATDLTWHNLNIKGFIPKSYTFLIVAHDGKLKFYIRFPQELKEFIKTRIYSQYPEIQFEEVDNPLGNLPPILPNSLFDGEIFDIRPLKEDAYPIKTYIQIENLPKEQQIDPISTFSEAATQISNKEWVIFQISALPTTPDNSEHGKKWIERGQKIINKLIGKEEKREPSIWEDVERFIVNLILAPFRSPEWSSTDKKEEKEFNLQKLTPGEREVIELIQKKLSKLGYWCTLRIAYLATKDVFEINKSVINHLILSTLKNFSTENLNGFNLMPLTYKKYGHPLSIFILKRREYNSFVKNLPISLPQWIKKKLKDKTLESGFILNTEELASLFHPPMEFVPPTGFERIPIREFPPSFI